VVADACVIPVHAPQYQNAVCRADFDRGVARKGLLDYNSIRFTVLDGFVGALARLVHFAQRFEFLTTLHSDLGVLKISANLARIVAGGPCDSGAAALTIFVG